MKKIILMLVMLLLVISADPAHSDVSVPVQINVNSQHQVVIDLTVWNRDITHQQGCISDKLIA